MAGVEGKQLTQTKGARKGDTVPVATSSYGVHHTLTGAATKPVRADDVVIQGVVRLFSDTDCFYRLDGEDAELVEPSTFLPANIERYENIRSGNLPDTNRGFSVIGTSGTLHIDTIV